MANLDDAALLIADAYAGALLDLTESKGTSAEVLSELNDLNELMRADPAIHRFFTDDSVDTDHRKQAWETALRGKMSDALLNTLQVLNEKGRAGLLPVLHERFRLLMEDRHGQVDVHVTTAQPLSDGQRHRLIEALKSRTGREPKLVERTDESVLGGLVLHIGDEKVDASAAARLRRLNAILADRAARELHSDKEYVSA